MFIRKSRKKPLANGSPPLLHQDHGKPRTRREFISQGLMAGSATLFGASVFSLFANPRQAAAALSSDLENLKESCGIAVSGAGKIPSSALIWPAAPTSRAPTYSWAKQVVRWTF